MAMKLRFSNIKNQSIFQPEFQNLAANGYNVIEFKKQPHAAGGIAIVYVQIMLKWNASSATAELLFHF